LPSTDEADDVPVRIRDRSSHPASELRLVVDFATVCAAEPEYDLRAFPGTGPGVELVTATMREYERRTGMRPDTDRVLAAFGVPVPG
jgi:hypothetical protein